MRADEARSACDYDGNFVAPVPGTSNLGMITSKFAGKHLVRSWLAPSRLVDLQQRGPSAAIGARATSLRRGNFMVIGFKLPGPMLGRVARQEPSTGGRGNVTALLFRQLLKDLNDLLRRFDGQ